MNPSELELWKRGVEEHNNVLQNLIDDRRKLKELMVEHSKAIFEEWDNIEFSQDLETVTVGFKAGYELDNKTLSGIGMEWDVIITDKFTQGIKVYPFGRV